MEIKKLADIVEWADGRIRDGGYYEEKYNNDASTAYCNVKAYELWRIRDVVLDGMQRHAVYTNALNQDIAAKAAKIDLLEKEIEGRKEGYHALKERLDHITALEEGWYANAQELVETCKSKNEEIEKLKKESEKWQDLAKMNRDTIVNQYEVCEEFKNKVAELEEMTRYWESQYEYVLKCRKEDIEDLEGRLKEEIDLVRSAEERLIELQKEKENENEELENTVKRLNKELADCKVKIRHQKENLDGINKTLEMRTKENERLIAVKKNQDKEIEAHESENARLSEKILELKRTIEKCKDYDTSLMDSLRINNDDLKEQVSKLKKELDETYKAWDTDSKNHSKRDMALVDEIAKKNDEIEKLKKERDKHMARVNDLRMELDCVKASKEKHEEAARDKTIEDLRESIKYWRAHCLAAQEARDAFMKEAEELRKKVNELKKEKKEGDDYAKSGFKLYVKNTLAEAEGNKNEANEVITEAVRSAYEEWGKEQKEKEETEVKGNGRTSSGRYPWGAKVRCRKPDECCRKPENFNCDFKDDIPCGEDSIE